MALLKPAYTTSTGYRIYQERSILHGFRSDPEIGGARQSRVHLDEVGAVIVKVVHRLFRLLIGFYVHGLRPNRLGAIDDFSSCENARAKNDTISYFLRDCVVSSTANGLPISRIAVTPFAKNRSSMRWTWTLVAV